MRHTTALIHKMNFYVDTDFMFTTVFFVLQLLQSLIFSKIDFLFTNY